MLGEKKDSLPPLPSQPHLQSPPIHNSQPTPDYLRQRQYYQPDQNDTTNFCYTQQKNKPQSNSVSGPLMVMLVSGMHIGWGICSPQLRLQEWHLNTYPQEYTMVILSWYLGAIIGSLLTLYIYTRLTKREIYYIAGGLCVISSGLFIGLSNNAAVLIIVRTLAGIAHGLAYVTGICHASENCIKEIRGTLISTFHYLTIMSALIVVILLPADFDSTADNFNFNMLIGTLCLIYAVLGMAFIPCLTFESVVYLIQRQQYREAIHNMIKLRNETAETWEIKNDFDEMKLMVAEDLRTKPSIFQDGNTRPFILILLTKFVVVLGFNYALNMIRVAALQEVTSEMWASATLLGIRVIVVTVSIFFVDVLGRRKLFFVSTMGAGCALLIYGLIHLTTDNAIGQSIPIFLFEVFSGIGILHIPDVLLSEAFPITKKIISMTICACTEYALHVVIIGVTYQMTVRQYLVPLVFTFGALICVLAAFLYQNLPETRVMSLRQARSEFRKKYDEVTFSREPLPPHINHYS